MVRVPRGWPSERMERKITEYFASLLQLFLVYGALFVVGCAFFIIGQTVWTLTTTYHEYWFMPFIPLFIFAKLLAITNPEQPFIKPYVLKQQLKYQLPTYPVHEDHKSSSISSLTSSSLSSSDYE